MRKSLLAILAVSSLVFSSASFAADLEDNRRAGAIQQLPDERYGSGGFTRRSSLLLHRLLLQSNTRQVQADHAEVVTTIVDLLAVFIFPHAEEAAFAAHRGFKRTGDFNSTL